MEFMIKLLTYGLITTIVGFVVSKTQDETKKFKFTKDEELYYDQKFLSKIYFVCSIIFTIMFIFISSLPSNLEGTNEIVANVIFIVFILILYLISYKYYVRFLKIGTDRIIYRKGLSKTKTLMYSDITVAKEDSFGNIMLYRNNKRVLKIPKELYAGYLLEKNKVPFEQVPVEQVNRESFTMKVTNFYKGIKIANCIVFLSVLILSICVLSGIGIIFCGIMLIICFVDCLNDYKKKFIVSKDEIVAISLFQKKNVKISDIVRVEKRNINNADVLYIYSNKGLETKISMLYSNSHLLEEIFKNKIEDN